jgi:holo-[acyl-carrier protein] synthase
MATTDIHGIGIDVIEVARIAAAATRHGDAFLNRFLTAAELAYCSAQARPAVHQAARFAAKEAVAKALGTGIGRDCGWHDIEIRRTPESGAPVVDLSGAAAAFAARNDIVEMKISISHTRETAVASALAVRRPRDLPPHQQMSSGKYPPIPPT